MVSTNTNTNNYSLTSTVKLNDGRQMPVFGLGTWRSEKGKVRNVVKAALLDGYIHLDCAYAYANHEEVGQGIKDAIEASNGKIKREDIWVTSKLWCTHHEPTRAKHQVDQILKDLQLSYLDLLLIHWPPSWQLDKDGKTIPDNPVFDDSHTIKDTWQALEELVSAGKLKSIGISNYTEAETEEILQFAKIKPAINQSESHPYFNNHPLARWNQQHGIHFTAYSPLGNISADKVEQSPLKNPTITKIAQAHNKSPAQVIIRWHLQNGSIVIPKTVNPDRVKENRDVFDFTLSDEEIQQINGLDKGAEGRLVNPKFRKGGKTNFEGLGSKAEN